MTTKKTGLELLREPFLPHQISKLPKPYKKDSPKGNCAECGGYHGLPAAHLDYVGHAALTDRLLDADPAWSWEPVAFSAEGLPQFDKTGGLWIRLTVCGITRLGYGHAEGKAYMDIGAREKEVIGDALRNAAMRFGAALDLWHKGDLHLDEETPPTPQKQPAMPQGQGQPLSGAREMVSPERLKELEGIAYDLHVLVFDENDVAIYEVLESIKDNDDKAALWTFLDSKVRAYIKKVCDRLRKEDEKVSK